MSLPDTYSSALEVAVLRSASLVVIATAARPQGARCSADGDSWVIVCSDGLCGNVQRGAGGGLTNDQIAKLANEV